MFSLLLVASTVVIVGDVKDPDKAVDGSLSTCAYFEGQSSVFEVRLNRITYVDFVEFFWDDPPESYSVDVSYDFINWKNLIRNYDCRGLPRYKGKMVSKNALFGEVVQVVRIRAEGTFRLAEIRISRLKPKIEIIRKPVLVKVERTRAVFEFATNYPTMAQISYSTKLEKVEMDKAVMDVSIKKYHRIAIGPLVPGERYFAKAIIRDAEGREVARSEVVEFYTRGEPNPYLDYFSYDAGEFSIALYMKASVVSSFEGVLTYPDGRKKFFKDDYPAKERFYLVEGLEPDTTYSMEIKLYNQARSKYSLYRRKVSTKPWNIAYQKPVKGTFKNPYIADVVTLSGNILSRAVDGSFSYLYGMANSFDPARSEQWLMVDLEEVYPIRQIRMYWREAAYPEDYRVLFSVDGRNWKVLKDHLNAGDFPTVRGRHGDLLKKVTMDLDGGGISARYVKLVIPKGSPYHKKIESYKFVQLFELEVIGDYAAYIKQKGGER